MLKDDVMEECLRVEKKANATQKERWIPVEKTYKAPEKDETVKKMEDDKQELVAQTEAAMKETENVRQALQRENQQKVEQLNIKIHKKEEQIKQLENDKGDLATKLEATIQETDNIKQTLQREHQQIVDQLHSKAKEKDGLIKLMEDDKRDLTNQFEVAKREAENTKQNLEREHQRIIEQFSVQANEKENKISQLEDTIRRQSTELDQIGVTLHEVRHSKETLQMTHEEILQQKRDLETQLAKALDPLENIEELKEVVDLNEEIGRGAYGVVKKVSLHGTICAAKDIHAIIINYAQQREFEVVKKNYLEECIKCSKLFHPNIVQFLGIHYPSEDAKLPWLVMEKMDCSLTSFVKKYTHVHSDTSLPVKILIIHDISLGLRYLHARDIIHRDLSSNNILLTKHLTAKIADLGVAKLIDPDGTRSHTLAPGTLYFLPPEATSTRPQYGKPVDVFSLGCVMIHLMTHEWPEPAVETHYDEVLGKKVVLSEVERRQLYLDRILEPRVLKDLILLCLHDSSKLRPVIAEVCETMETLKTAIPRQHLVTGDNSLEFEEHLRIQEIRANEQLMEREVEINRLSAALHEANK
ncbi:probable serine/threonine-protein kinase kinX isoform X2 [Dysidea avara]|uniref:probable serine/threonine-protein kinase kinX isoform X2 n=1 Tax=Dysidea avara TaxID=196820 RepID=UPI00331B499D